MIGELTPGLDKIQANATLRILHSSLFRNLRQPVHHNKV